MNKPESALSRAIAEIGYPDPPDLVPYSRAYRRPVRRKPQFWLCKCDSRFQSRAKYLEHAYVCPLVGHQNPTEVERQIAREETKAKLRLIRAERAKLDPPNNQPRLMAICHTIMGECPKVGAKMLAREAVRHLLGTEPSEKWLHAQVLELMRSVAYWRGENAGVVKAALKRYEKATRHAMYGAMIGIALCSPALAETCHRKIDNTITKLGGYRWQWRMVDDKQCWFYSNRLIAKEDLVWSFTEKEFNSDIDRVIKRQFYHLDLDENGLLREVD